jgi:hypothetical protein
MLRATIAPAMIMVVDVDWDTRFVASSIVASK